jgi:hypothetical protein
MILHDVSLFRAVVISVFLLSIGLSQSQSAKKVPTKQAEPSEANPEKGYLIDVTIAADEPCARDYVKALNSESGIEQRKMLSELDSLECIKRLPGIYKALGYEARSIRISGHVVRILRVQAVVDREKTEMVTKQKFDVLAGLVSASGWIVSNELKRISEKELLEIIAHRRATP